MPKSRRRERRRGAYSGNGEGRKERPIVQTAAPLEGPVAAVKGPVSAPVAPRARNPQLRTQSNISTEEQYRIISSDIKKVGIITAALVALLFVIWWLL
jgi:hypothetical protein